jgi:hypothetical protein
LTDQPRRKDARVVDDQQISGTKKLGEMRNGGMRGAAGLPVEVEQPSRRSLGDRFLRYQLRRQMEVEIADIHALNVSWLARVRRSTRPSHPT